MKRLSLLALLCLCFSCKRSFTCHCYSVNSSGQTVDPKEFTVKDKNEKNAGLQCSLEYSKKVQTSDTVKCSAD